TVLASAVEGRAIVKSLALTGMLSGPATLRAASELARETPLLETTATSVLIPPEEHSAFGAVIAHAPYHRTLFFGHTAHLLVIEVPLVPGTRAGCVTDVVTRFLSRSAFRSVQTAIGTLT